MRLSVLQHARVGEFKAVKSEKYAVIAMIDIALYGTCYSLFLFLMRFIRSQASLLNLIVI